ncbi:MAG: PEP-utilizing enzyme [Actinomycetota bacterium]
MSWDPNEPLTWTAPGPGEWSIDRSHVNRPATPINQHIQSVGTGRGTRRVFVDIGGPVQALELRFVNGLVYTRVFPLVGAEKPPRSLPPKPILVAMSRLHPRFRQRLRVAKTLMVDRPWRKVVADWNAPDGLRSRIQETNLVFQDVDLGSLDDAALLQHITRVVDHATAMFEEHFWLHGYDLCPIGLLLHATRSWGLTPAEVLPLLEGASPSTSEAEAELRRIRDLVTATGVQPTSLEQLRTLSPEIAASVDHFLRLRGHLVISRYDIDGLLLIDAPEVLLNRIMNARDVTRRAEAVDSSLATLRTALRERIPVVNREEFDMLLDEARAAMDLRDDNGPHTVEWPLGLIRLALLELGRRLVARSKVSAPEHAFELTLDELSAIWTSTPAAGELAARHRWRASVNVDDAPRKLGGPEPVPPLDVLPAPLALIAGFVKIVISEAGIDGEQRTQGLHGYGVGTATHRGTARVATSPEEALMCLEPGDVLVVPCTTPAYNMVVGVAGALVTAEGGSLSHAAVIARELGIPGVIGAPMAMRDIPDGATVEVDPVAGIVRLVS